MKSISKRQEQILSFIEEITARRGYPPSVREICDAVGLASSSTVHGHLGKLESKGYIRRDPARPRAIEVLSPITSHQRVVHVPVVGRVTAGKPILAVENVEEHFAIAKDFMPSGDNVFMLRVQGDSMINAGILDGDYVFVRQQETANNGEIVVALINDEATVKRFFREADHIRLQPENPLMDPIIVPEATVLGKVVGVFRRIA